MFDPASLRADSRRSDSFSVFRSRRKRRRRREEEEEQEPEQRQGQQQEQEEQPEEDEEVLSFAPAPNPDPRNFPEVSGSARGSLEDAENSRKLMKNAAKLCTRAAS